MIALEYIIAQYQDDNVSVAINSRKVAQQNPALIIMMYPIFRTDNYNY